MEEGLMARSPGRLAVAVVRPPQHRHIAAEAAPSVVPVRVPVIDFFAPEVKSRARSNLMQQIAPLPLEDAQLQQDEEGLARDSEAVDMALIIAVLLCLIGILVQMAM